jgi:hypothetical protein
VLKDVSNVMEQIDDIPLASLDEQDDAIHLGTYAAMYASPVVHWQTTSLIAQPDWSMASRKHPYYAKIMSVMLLQTYARKNFPRS